MNRFLEAWKLIVAHGDDSLLGPALPNYAASAARLLERDPTAALKPNSRPALLIEHIKQMIGRGDQVSKLSRAACRGLLDDAIAGGHRTSRAEWTQVLRQLEVGPASSKLATWLFGALSGQREPSDARLRAIAFLLHRRAFAAHEKDFLADLIGAEFTRAYLRNRLPTHIELLTGSERLRSALNGVIEQSRHDAAARNARELLANGGAASLQYQLPQARWAQRVHAILRRVRVELGRYHEEHSKGSFHSAVEATAARIADAFVAAYVNTVVQYGLTAHELVPRLPDAPLAPERLEWVIAREITDLLSEEGVFAPQPVGEWWPGRLYGVDVLFATGVTTTVGKLIADKLLPRVRGDLGQRITT